MLLTLEIELFIGKSWWRKLDENSRDILEVLEGNKVGETYEAVEEILNVEILRWIFNISALKYHNLDIMFTWWPENMYYELGFF